MRRNLTSTTRTRARKMSDAFCVPIRRTSSHSSRASRRADLAEQVHHLVQASSILGEAQGIASPHNDYFSVATAAWINHTIVTTKTVMTTIETELAAEGQTEAHAPTPLIDVQGEYPPGITRRAIKRIILVGVDYGTTRVSHPTPRYRFLKFDAQLAQIW